MTTFSKMIAVMQSFDLAQPASALELLAGRSLDRWNPDVVNGKKEEKKIQGNGRAPQNWGAAPERRVSRSSVFLETFERFSKIVKQKPDIVKKLEKIKGLSNPALVLELASEGTQDFGRWKNLVSEGLGDLQLLCSNEMSKAKECPLCTFFNSSGGLKCEMCNTEFLTDGAAPKPEQLSKQMSKPLQASGMKDPKQMSKDALAAKIGEAKDPQGYREYCRKLDDLTARALSAKLDVEEAEKETEELKNAVVAAQLQYSQLEEMVKNYKKKELRVGEELKNAQARWAKHTDSLKTHELKYRATITKFRADAKDAKSKDLSRVYAALISLPEKQADATLEKLKPIDEELKKYKDVIGACMVCQHGPEVKEDSEVLDGFWWCECGHHWLHAECAREVREIRCGVCKKNVQVVNRMPDEPKAIIAKEREKTIEATRKIVNLLKQREQLVFEQQIANNIKTVV